MSYLARLKQLEIEKNSHYAPSTEPPKPTKGAFGSFGSTPSPRIEKKYIGDLEIMPVWDAADWRAYYDERAGVAEYDGGLPRSEAEQQAYLCCVSEWLCQNHTATEPGQCAWCKRGDLPGRPLLPFGDENHGHSWLHGECWGAWWAQRREDAIEALAALGIHEGGQSA